MAAWIGYEVRMPRHMTSNADAFAGAERSLRSHQTSACMRCLCTCMHDDGSRCCCAHCEGERPSDHMEPRAMPLDLGLRRVMSLFAGRTSGSAFAEAEAEADGYWAEVMP